MQTATQRKPVPGKTVLLVDDNANVRAHLRELFLSDGFTLCAEADNGMKAVEIAPECKPDVIILDLVMPVMNGLDAARKLKELLPKTPIILFSLHSRFLKQQELTSLGIAAAFAKSAPLDQLLKKANQLIGE